MSKKPEFRPQLTLQCARTQLGLLQLAKTALQNAIHCWPQWPTPKLCCKLPKLRAGSPYDKLTRPVLEYRAVSKAAAIGRSAIVCMLIHLGATHQALSEFDVPMRPIIWRVPTEIVHHRCSSSACRHAIPTRHPKSSFSC